MFFLRISETDFLDYVEWTFTLTFQQFLENLKILFALDA
jgi:hypothetical protein